MSRLLAVLASLLIVAGVFAAASGIVAVAGPFLMHHADNPVFKALPYLVTLGAAVVVALRSRRRANPDL